MLPKSVRFNATYDEIDVHNGGQSASSSPNDESGPTLPRMNSLLLQGTCPSLDLSVPSAALQADRRLSPELMSKPACNPPQTHATIRIVRPGSESACGFRAFSVSHYSAGEPITVGDVLNTIHNHLRQPVPPQQASDPQAERYHAHRVGTVDECLRNVSDPAKQREGKQREETQGVRLIDELYGVVCFNGVSVQPTGVWNVNLRPSGRYANVAGVANSG